MKKIFSQLIHWLIMPCSHVPELVEQKKAGSLPRLKSLRLRIHLLMCKWCSAYVKKVEHIDSMLTRKYRDDKENAHLEDTDIQSFKERIKRKITP